MSGIIACESTEDVAITPRMPIRHVLVDDFDFIRDSWQIAAEKFRTALKIYSCPHALISELHIYDRETVFYVDFEMGTNINGRDLARIIKRELGATVVLVTGHEANLFDANVRDGIFDRVSGKEFILPEYLEPRVPSQIKEPVPVHRETGQRLESREVIAPTKQMAKSKTATPKFYVGTAWASHLVIQITAWLQVVIQKIASPQSKQTKGQI